MKIGFLVAMESEYAPFLSSLGECIETERVCDIEFSVFGSSGNQIILGKCGIGEIAAASTAALLIGKFGCDRIVNFGLVGSLDGKEVGTVVAVKDVVYYDFDLSPFGRPIGMSADIDLVYLPADLSVLHGALADLPTLRLASGDKFVSDSAFKNRLVADFGANICDMEGAGIALTCTRAGVPFTMIKLVSDAADDAAVETFSASKTRAFGAAVDLVLSLLR